jgi:hypothetical protein
LGVQFFACQRRIKWRFGSNLLPITRLGPKVMVHAVAILVLLWTPRFFPAQEPSGRTLESPEFPLFRSGLEDLKGAYFANAPIRLIDGIVLRDSQATRFANFDVAHPRVLHVGDGSSILVSVFFYNAARNPFLADTTLISAARATANVDTTAKRQHSISAGVVGDNTKAIYSTTPGRGGDLTITSDEPVRLVYVPGSTFACARRPPIYERRPPTPADPTGVCADARRGGPVQLLHLPDRIVNGAVPIGYIPGQISGFIVFRLNVIES